MTAARRFLILAAGLLWLPGGCDQVKEAVGLDQAEPEAAPAKEEATQEDAPNADADSKAVDAPAAAAAPPAVPAKAESPPPEPEAAAPAPEPTGTEAAAAPTPAPEAAAPCILGSWDATDYTAAVDRAIRKDPQLRSMKTGGSGGHITYALQPPEDGTGVITAKADHLTYSFAGKVQGIGVNVKIDINGETIADYTLTGSDGISIAKPTSNTMKVKANVNIKGIGTKRASDKIDLDFDGDFVFDCSEESLEVWRDNRTAARPLKFKRTPSG
jgi:hypothetical protein